MLGRGNSNTVRMLLRSLEAHSTLMNVAGMAQATVDLHPFLISSLPPEPIRADNRVITRNITDKRQIKESFHLHGVLKPRHILGEVHLLGTNLRCRPPPPAQVQIFMLMAVDPLY